MLLIGRHTRRRLRHRNQDSQHIPRVVKPTLRADTRDLVSRRVSRMRMLAGFFLLLRVVHGVSSRTDRHFQVLETKAWTTIIPLALAKRHVLGILLAICHKVLSH